MDPIYAPQTAKVLYGPGALDTPARDSKRREYLVVVRQDVYCAGVVEQAVNARTAKLKIRDLVDDGGGIWNTLDGDLPEEICDHEFSVVACVDVTGWEMERVQKLLEQYQVISDVTEV